MAGFEPATFCSQSRHATKLRYIPYLVFLICLIIILKFMSLSQLKAKNKICKIKRFLLELEIKKKSELNEVILKLFQTYMAFAKRWKTNWELKSLTFDQLFNVIVEVVTKQLDEVEKSEVALGANLVIDYEADSVDVVAMLLYLEDMFKNASQTTRTVVPTDKLGQIVLVEDIFDIIYEVLVGIESKMDPFVAIKPDFDALEKRQKMGELYPKD